MKQAPAFWEVLNPTSLLMWPLSLVFGWISDLRKLAYEKGLLTSKKLLVPVIIVGNIRVGGTGKTPIVIALAKELEKRGFRPGIISRGYVQNKSTSSSTRDDVHEVFKESNPHTCGDEPVLMAQLLSSINIPVFIGKKRFETGQALLKQYPNCNVIISDDGLQHYALSRQTARTGGHDIEVVVRDGRGEGNGFLLPAGPLRESHDRPRDLTLQTGLDVGISKAVYMNAPIYVIPVELGQAYLLGQPENTQALSSFKDKKVLAAAGLGNPQKFFNILSEAGLGASIEMKVLALPDHFSFETNPFEDPAFADIEAILITEKDAVKCHALAEPRLWVVPLQAQLPEQLLAWIESVVQRP
jgi:tetraacyldisaccharide 4'-kinase